MSSEVLEGRRLSELTTLGVGGPARALAEVVDPTQIRPALDYAHHHDLPIAVVGGGSNLLVADRGYQGLVLRYLADEMSIEDATGHVRAEGGRSWDELVRACVERDLAGLECTVGIPGLVGAAPVQNVGAYGQELAGVLKLVETIDLQSGEARHFAPEECEFSYRHSRFKGRERGRHLITAVELELEPGGDACLEYGELRRSFPPSTPPTLDAVAERVAELRRSKGMLIEDVPGHLRSAGSFFTNPILDRHGRDRLHEALREAGREVSALPEWPVDADHVKCSAAWLIEASGLHRGLRRGPVGLSPHHVLALVNHGGATAADLLALAFEVRDRVLEQTGVRLVPEPVPLGFEPHELGDLWGA